MCVVLCFFCFGLQILFFNLIHHGQKRKWTYVSVEQKLESVEKLESGVSVTRICEESEHLDLTDIRQYQTSPPL
jgi:hypothetical protein